ncbi:MAG: FapA family protein [Spirochaetes bacterium]|nr:FapA family protein [Spirochaetota bacterium]
MIRVEKDKLKKDMILAEDVSGKNNLNLRSGTILSDRFINILNNDSLFPITHVSITDESYQTIGVKSSYEIKTDIDAIEKAVSPNFLQQLGINEVGAGNYVLKTDLDGIREKINIAGDLLVSGNVNSCSLLQIAGDITIVGDLSNTNLVAKGDVTIQRDVTNDNKQYKINSFGKFTANEVKNANINANYIQIRNLVINSEIFANSSIDAPSAMHIQNSILRAGSNIVLGSVKQETTLIIFSDKQMKMVKSLLEIEKKLNNFDSEIEPLKQSIRVFQILKNKVNELPDLKRKELIENVKKFKEKMENKKNLQDQFVTLKIETAKIKESRIHNPIIIKDEVEKGTRVIIDNSSFVVQMKDKGVVFYKKGIIIMGKKNHEWGKIL